MFFVYWDGKMTKMEFSSFRVSILSDFFAIILTVRLDNSMQNAVQYSMQWRMGKVWISAVTKFALEFHSSQYIFVRFHLE